MSEFVQGALVEATRGEQLVRSRLCVDDEGDLYLPHLGFLTNCYTNESPVLIEGWTLKVVAAAGEPLFPRKVKVTLVGKGVI